MSSLDLQNPETRPPAYHRKEKSLGLLCSNFLRLYSEGGVATFELDDAASKLGVERRRMYDVVNILESIRIIAKKGKNQYSWKGFGEVPRALEELKEDGLRETFNHSSFCNPVEVSKIIENRGSSNLQNNWEARSSASLRNDNRRDKSLVILTQSFIKLFLCSDMDFILLDDAAQALLGYKHDTTALRTKVRRLYDIANVFSSMNLIEKTHFPESRKPAFRWLGWKEKPENGSNMRFVSKGILDRSEGIVDRSEGISDLNESKKRLFGIDITNNISKRNRVESSMNWINQTVIDLPMNKRHGDLGIVHDGIKLKQRAKHSSKGIEFGPFAPVNVSGLKDPEKEKSDRVSGELGFNLSSSITQPR